MNKKLSTQLWMAIVVAGSILSPAPTIIAGNTAKNQIVAEKRFKEDFIEDVKTMALKKNREVLQEKAAVKRFRELTQNGSGLSSSDKLWLQKVAVRYQVTSLASKPIAQWSSREWQTLENKIDIVPVSIVVAQAVHESNFGRSNLAQKGHNLFGQKTQKTGYLIKCGTTTKTFKVFKSHQDSVNAYIDNINGCHAYREFRMARLSCRDNNQCLEGLALLDHIAVRYAEDQNYTKNVTRLMTQYDMRRFDYII